MDNNGFLDIFIENSGFPPFSRSILFEQLSNHAFEDKAKLFGLDIMNPSGSVVVDLNNDGKLDFIMGQSNIRNSSMKTKLYVFENQIDTKLSRSYKIHLGGKYANKQGIGSMVILKTNKKYYRRWVEYNYGPQPSQNEAFVHFALSRPDEYPLNVEVRWPIAFKDSSGRKVPLYKKYSMKNIPKNYQKVDLTLCETGRMFATKTTCPDF